MAEVDQVARGTVKKVMHYGAMVQLEDGTVGLVHISELANRFVEDVAQHCCEGDAVVVRVLECKSDGRWEFSIKKARAHEMAKALASEKAYAFGSDQPMYDASSSMPLQTPRPRISPQARAAFDEKMRDFLSDSSDHIEDVRRHHENRLGGKRR